MFGAAFNRIPYLPELRTVVRRILGTRGVPYPAKVLRAVYPERPQARPRGRYIHYDYGVSGVQDMLTSWIPLDGDPHPARRPGAAARRSPRAAPATAAAQQIRTRLGDHHLPAG